MTVRILKGDCRDVLRELPDESVHCVITSPPYWGLRDFGVEPSVWDDGWHGCFGLEPTYTAYVEHMVEVARELKRVLRTDGTMWLNLGDSFYSLKTHLNGQSGLKYKDLVGIPWRVAFALQEDGWWLRQDIIWNKPNAMPESVTDRCTRSHEYLFLLTKSHRYVYDGDAIRVPYAAASLSKHNYKLDCSTSPGRHRPGNTDERYKQKLYRKPNPLGRNKRSVWTVATQRFSEAHFATFPPDLITDCIKAGCPVGGVVLDPFGGAGTTGLVADRLGRDAILIELNPDYAAMAERRMRNDAGMFAQVIAV
jgi:DNA modification methylase